MSALGSTAYVGGSLEQQVSLGAAEAAQLADTINAVVAPDYTVSCVVDGNGPQYTAVAFSIPNRSDTDVWYQDYGCPLLSNGPRTIGPLINGFGGDVISLLHNKLASEATVTS